MGEHRLHVAAQGLDAGGGHLMTKELDGGGGEHALLRVDDQARLAQPREDFSQMLQMFLFISAGYDEVVQVAEDEGEARQDAIHHPLEVVARVAQPKRRNSNKPNGVQMAVFLMSAGCIGI